MLGEGSQKDSECNNPNSLTMVLISKKLSRRLLENRVKVQTPSVEYYMDNIILCSS